MKELNKSQLAILTYLKSICNEDGKTTATTKMIKEVVNLTHRVVVSNIRKLEEFGYIECEFPRQNYRIIKIK